MMGSSGSSNKKAQKSLTNGSTVANLALIFAQRQMIVAAQHAFGGYCLVTIPLPSHPSVNPPLLFHYLQPIWIELKIQTKQRTLDVAPQLAQ